MDPNPIRSLQGNSEGSETRHLPDHADPMIMIKRLADLTEVDFERLRLWTFARAAADPREDWTNPIWMDIARALARRL
jgi:hypothetical protein